MIPINLAIIGAGNKAASKSRGLLIGSVYGLSMAITYGATGLVVVLTGATMGVLNASPIFNIIIAIIFIILSLAMFDVIMIDFTRFKKWSKNTNKYGHVITAMIMGSLSALLSGACVAPVVISVILYSTDLYATGNYTGLLLPFLLGVGMAIPWPIIGAGISILPKPGKWMNKIKYVFGIFILIMAGYYLYLGIALFNTNKTELETFNDRQAKQVMDIKKEQNITILNSGLLQALQEKKPVVIDFGAYWCKNCQLMKKTTFKNEKVISKLNAYIFIDFQVDDPEEKNTSEVLSHFKVLGLPTFIVLKPK
jgi:thiol:disulfide interchange protein